MDANLAEVIERGFGEVPAKLLKSPKYRLREELSGVLPGTSMGELKSDIKANGVQDNLLCRVVGEQVEVVAGQRRWLNAVELDISVPIRIRKLTDEEAFIAALNENLIRKSLTPLEEAAAYRRYILENGWGSVTELAKRVHQSPSHISQLMSLLKQEEIVPLVKTGKLSVSEAEELSGLPPEKAKELADLSIKARLEVPEIRQAKSMIQAGFAPQQAVEKVVTFPEWKPPKMHARFDPVQVAREDIEATLRQTLKRIDSDLGYLPDGKEKAQWIEAVRYPTHQLVNAAIKLLKQYGAKKHE